jgi:uncharacterized protein YdeI (YjbR/CyaY-like superfamily)
MEAIYFASPAELRAWLEANHETATELLVGFYRKETGRPSVTWPEVVDEALCVGWIDGIRKGVDAQRYTIRLTPRKRGSIWSAVNIRNVERLIAEGRMRPAGLAAFERRDDARSRGYSHERATATIPPELEARFRAHPDAWAFWAAQPPGYRKTFAWWIVSARRDETRERRLDELIAECAAGRRIDGMTSRAPRAKG